MARAYLKRSRATPNILLRKEAIRQGEKHYYTGKTCKNGHIDLREVSGGKCLSCSSMYSGRYRNENPEKTKEFFKNWYQNNIEYNLERTSRYYKQNKETISLKRKTLYKERLRELNKKYNIKNRARRTFQAANRRALKSMATPDWLSEEDKWFIEEIYSFRELKSKILEEEYHVDHIIPLNSKIVCGLHVPWNLRIITAEENISKSNRLEQSLTAGG